jgi:hypothetical protein
MMLVEISLVLRVILGFFFTLTGLLKVPDLNGFYVILVSYNLFPSWFARLSAYTLPLAEIFAGIWLMTGRYQVYSSLLVLLLLFSSTVVIVVALLKKQKIQNCGCFGTAFKNPVSWWKFLENMVWIVVAVSVLLSAL